MQENKQRRVYAIFGSDPELIAYAMAKYSRSNLSMKESLADLNQQRAEKFLNTYYFQYGHRSIADLAHVCLAVENISILAAMEVVDEPRWDGQERSTRYQDFRDTGYYFPPNLASTKYERIYRDTIDSLFSEYYRVVGKLTDYLHSRFPRPSDIQEASYERTIKARAFDSARYLLPLCTVTSVGQIVNARVLEEQIARLKSHQNEEVREIGELIKRASTEPAHDIYKEKMEKLLQDLNGVMPEEAKRSISEVAAREVRVAPTLVKYAEPRPYLTETYKELRLIAAQLLSGLNREQPSTVVDLLEEEEPLDEAVNTLLYRASDHCYRRIQTVTQGMSLSEKKEVLAAAFKYRGRHDEVIRELRVGHSFKFDILMDIGGFRDLQRHRRCVKICQEINPLHNYEVPDDLRAARITRQYEKVMQKASAAFQVIAEEFPESAKYVIPLGYRRRSLFKMDFAEAHYICELRTAPQGHFSYQAVAYHIYLCLREKCPELARFVRVHETWFDPDRLKR